MQISEVKHVFEEFLAHAVIGFPSSHGAAKVDVDHEDSTPLLDTKYLRLCKIKDRYSAAHMQTPSQSRFYVMKAMNIASSSKEM